MEYFNEQFYQSVEQCENSSYSSGNIIEEYNEDSDENMSDGEKLQYKVLHHQLISCKRN